MSWHCSRALVAEYSAANCSDGELSAQLNTTPTPDQFYWPDKTTEHSRLSRFGMTCEPLTAELGEAVLMWFLEASRAKTSALQVEATDLTESVPVSGRKWLGSLAKYDHDSRSWRTAQHLLEGGLAEFSETWPRWGSMLNGESFLQPTPEHLISESESGFWQTPVADDAVNRKSGKWNSRGEPKLSAQVMLPTPCTVDSGSFFNTSNSPNAVKRPTLGAMAKHNLWPTPNARDGKGAPGQGCIDRGGRQSSLPAAVKKTEGGQLNPDWVEWLMGWPIGWTALKPLATARLAEWQQQHGESSEAPE